MMSGRVKALVGSVVSTLCDPMDCKLARLLCPWGSPGKNTGVVAMPSSRVSSRPRDWIQVFHIASRFFTIWATREALWYHKAQPVNSRPGHNWFPITLSPPYPSSFFPFSHTWNPEWWPMVQTFVLEKGILVYSIQCTWTQCLFWSWTCCSGAASLWC